MTQRYGSHTPVGGQEGSTSKQLPSGWLTSGVEPVACEPFAVSSSKYYDAPFARGPPKRILTSVRGGLLNPPHVIHLGSACAWSAVQSR